VDIDPTFKTEFQVAYDEKNLYVLVRMFDPHPDSIMRVDAPGCARPVRPDQASSTPMTTSGRLRACRES
jgi:hypothetical protein